jgi:hypothetical protein
MKTPDESKALPLIRALTLWSPRPHEILPRDQGSNVGLYQYSLTPPENFGFFLRYLMQCRGEVKILFRFALLNDFKHL